MSPEDVRGAAIRGDFRTVDAFLAATRDDADDAIRAWRVALGAMRAAATPEPPPSIEAVAAFESAAAPVRAIAALACVEGERYAVAAFDRPGLERWAALHERLGDPGCAPLWRRLLDGDTERLAEDARGIGSAGAKAGDASVVIESASIAALAALARGDLEAATSLARRASRMARTEAFPQLEYLAHLVLARLRRHTGRPHLAARILGALARIASPRWQRWIAWESGLAGAGPLLDASVAAGWPDLARERDDVTRAMDPDSDLTGASETVRGFLGGTSDAIPGPLVGPAFAKADAVLVLARPGAPARRLFASDRALAPSLGAVDKPGRTETAISVLALAGRDLDDATFFRAVYGFVYNEPLHRGTLDVLLHRVRAALGDFATMRRDAAVGLDVHRAFTVADPRCERSPEERLLAALAARGKSSAREAAESLGIPLRTVQLALAKLVDDGACEAVRAGRAVEYRVEDTTFSEPTNAK